MTLGPGHDDLPDFSGPGPFSVGVTTLRPPNGPVTEVWYPVDGDSVVGLTSEVFDHLSVWPIEIREQIPQELFPAIDTGAYRDASPSAQGPFPLVVFSHGFGGYRQMSSFYTTQLASWGFVVAAPDHAGRGFQAAIEGTARSSDDNDRSDIQSVLAAAIDRNLPKVVGAVVDQNRIAVAGYSAGATTAVAAADLGEIDSFIALSGRGELTDAARSKPALMFAEENDRVVPAFVSEVLFERVTGTATLVVIAGGGHSALIDLCPAWAEAPGKMDRLAPWVQSVDQLANGCGPDYPDSHDVWAVLQHVTVAHLYTVFGIDEVGLALSEKAVDAVSRARLSGFETKP
jgi:dienelactone hydrolase